jgi:hypothetical protein
MQRDANDEMPAPRTPDRALYASIAAQCDERGMLGALRSYVGGARSVDAGKALDEHRALERQGRSNTIQYLTVVLPAFVEALANPWDRSRGVDFEIGTRYQAEMSDETLEAHVMQSYFRASVHAMASKRGRANVFRVAPALIEALIATDLTSVGSADVRLPFEAFYAELPANTITHAGNGGALDTAIFVRLDTTLHVHFSGPETSASLGIALSGACPEPSHAIDECLVLGMPVDGDALCRLAIGLILYIGSPSHDVRPSSNAKNESAWDEAVTAARSAPRAPGRSPTGRALWDVGASIKRLRVAALDVLVRGHWRRQSHGPGHTLRKMIWVQPHVRLATGAPVAGHDYEVRV